MTLTDSERERYAAQIALPMWGDYVQQRLRGSAAIVVGLGALGSPAATYLAAAGVGRLGVVDAGVVELADLQRQVLHFTPDVGLPKAENAGVKLRALNPEVQVDPYPAWLDGANAEAICTGADVVLDCGGSAETRQAVNDACCALGVPLVTGSADGLSGAVMSVVPGRSACRCCAGEAAPGALRADGGSAQAVGGLAGAVGSLQALEALKLLTGVGQPLLNCVLAIDGATLQHTTVAIARRADCAACSRVPASAQSG